MSTLTVYFIGSNALCQIVAWRCRMKLRNNGISPRKKPIHQPAIGIGRCTHFLSDNPTYWVVLFSPWSVYGPCDYGVLWDTKMTIIADEPKYKLANKVRLGREQNKPALLIWHPEVVVYTGQPSVATHPAGYRLRFLHTRLDATGVDNNMRTKLERKYLADIFLL